MLAAEKKDIKAMFSLAALYRKQGKNGLAEKYWLQIIEENQDVHAMHNLSIMYYAQNRNKEQVKQYIKEINQFEEMVSYEVKHTMKIIIEIWAGVLSHKQEIEEKVIAICEKESENEFFIKRLLIHHQYSLVDKLFRCEEFGKRLQEEYMGLYYASRILNKNSLKFQIPSELKIMIDNILEEIKNEQVRYS